MLDLGAGHASASGTLCGRVVAALKAAGLLSESVGAGYIERSWPPALKASGAWPLSGLRQSFLNGVLTRLVDPDVVLHTKIMEFVHDGSFGLGSGQKPDGTYERVWFRERPHPAEISFEPTVFLLTRARAEELAASPAEKPADRPEPPTTAEPTRPGADEPPPRGAGAAATVTVLRLTGSVPPEVWNRLGTKLLPKLRAGSDLRVAVDLAVSMRSDSARALADELRLILDDLDLADRVRIVEE
jgi:hypothetical protein